MTERDKERALAAYLVAAARTGERRAAGQLAQLYGPRLLAHATRLMGEAEAARDVVQEAWLEILRGLPGLRDERAFLSWALQITSRRVARTIRARQRQRVLASETRLIAETGADAMPNAAEAASDAARVHAALGSLPPAQRATVALFYLEELSVAEVAAALDVPIGTVKTRLMHARDKLRARLGPLDEGE